MNTIPYASPLIRATIDGESATVHMSDLRQALLDAEWESLSTDAASQTGTFTGLPANNQTVTVAGQVYTFVTSLSGGGTPNQVVIGGTAAACASNLADAINDNAVNEGTTYGNGTTANASVTASVNSGTITVTAITAGPEGNSITLSETLSNFTWTAGSLNNGGYTLASRGDHPGHYRVVFQMFLSSGTINYRARNEANTTTFTRTPVPLAAGRAYMARVTLYDLWVLREGVYDYWYCGALYIPSEWAAPAVVSVTNGSTTNLEITAHGMSNGQSITLTGFSGSADWLAQNGRSFSVTVVDANNIEINLDSSSFAAATPGYAGGSNFIALSLHASHGTHGSSNTGYRRQVGCHSGNSVPAASWNVFNQYAFAPGLGNTLADIGYPVLALAMNGNHSVVGSRIGLSPGHIYSPAVLSHGMIGGNDNPAIVGVMWNAVVYRHGSNSGVELDADQIPLDGHFFYNLRDPSISESYWYGSLFIEVPEAP
jgi:hypothetical protein